MRLRIGLGVTTAIAALWLFAGSAWACLTADLTTSPSAGPGDPVSFGISGIEPGAHYTVTFQGQTVASGTNTTNNNGVSGSFSMPDLGSQEQTTYAEADTIHPEDGESFHLTSSIEYLPPAPAAAPEQPAPAATSAPVSQARHHVRQQAPIAASPQVAKQKQDPASTVAPAGSAPSNSVGSEPGPNDPGSGSAEAKGSTHESASVSHRALDALASTTSVGPAKVPTMGLLLMALIFIAGTALTGFVIYLSQTGPDPEAAIKAPAPVPLDPVEAELQEMIGDEMARQLLSDLELGERVTVGSV
jgi:hypothetical protein